MVNPMWLISMCHVMTSSKKQVFQICEQRACVQWCALVKISPRTIAYLLLSR